MRIQRLVIALFLPLIVEQQAFGVVELAKVFGDHMVLQSDVPLPIWGTAEAGERITVTFASEVRSATADTRGNWRVDFPPLPASSVPATLAVKGSNRLTVHDVLIGEVWICAGQSNMEFPLRNATDGATEVRAANDPAIRLLRLSSTANGATGTYDTNKLEHLEPRRFCHGTWEKCNSESASEFSAVGYFFASRLHQELDVPIGVICNAIGGTPTEAWIRQVALESDSRLADLVQGNWLDNPHLGEWCRQRAMENLAQALQQDQSIPADSLGPNHCFKPSFMWKAAMEPLVPYAMRGVLWYQGESNADSLARVEQHELLFPLLIHDWRREWGQGEFPFLYVQLPGLGRPHWPQFRESQRRFLGAINNVGMAVTIDLGHPSNVHPTNKRPVGERLARRAIATTYAKKIATVYSGPLFQRMVSEQGSLLLHFDHVGDGLASSDAQPLRHFEVAGTDGQFQKATAMIVGNSIELTCDQVSRPTDARYAWSPFPDPPVNFVNSAGLPASPFSTVSSEQ